MAGFTAHLSTGAMAGATVGFYGFYTGSLKITEAFAVGVTGTIGGLLPDIDSDTGKPLQLLFQLVSVLVPVFLYSFFIEHFGRGVAFSICYFTLFYLFINYMVCPVIKKLTAHRGVIHSIPFAVLCGEIAYLSLFQGDQDFALFTSISIFVGCMVHLTLDEFNSIKFRGGIIPYLNSYSGTALTFTSKDIVSVLIVYTMIIVFGLGIFTKSNGSIQNLFNI